MDVQSQHPYQPRYSLPPLSVTNSATAGSYNTIAEHTTSRRGEHSPNYSSGMKRPAPDDQHPFEQPAKRQSKWSNEENQRIIELRGTGMKWEEVARYLPGRTALSCRLHYQNFLERRAEWDEEKKNKLARLYERFRREMWERVARELKMPWRAAEEMHWQLGKTELAQRAGVNPFYGAADASSSASSTGVPSQPSGSGVPITTSFIPHAGPGMIPESQPNQFGSLPPSVAPSGGPPFEQRGPWPSPVQPDITPRQSGYPVGTDPMYRPPPLPSYGARYDAPPVQASSAHGILPPPPPPPHSNPKAPDPPTRDLHASPSSRPQLPHPPSAPQPPLSLPPPTQLPPPHSQVIAGDSPRIRPDPLHIPSTTSSPRSGRPRSLTSNSPPRQVSTLAAAAQNAGAPTSSRASMPPMLPQSVSGPTSAPNQAAEMPRLPSFKDVTEGLHEPDAIERDALQSRGSVGPPPLPPNVLPPTSVPMAPTYSHSSKHSSDYSTTQENYEDAVDEVEPLTPTSSKQNPRRGNKRRGGANTFISANTPRTRRASGESGASRPHSRRRDRNNS